MVISFTGNIITNIHPLLKQFRSLMIPPSVHYHHSLAFTQTSHSLSPSLTHSLTHSLSVLFPFTHLSYLPSNHHYLTERSLINSRLQFTNTLPPPIRHSLAFTHSLTHSLTHHSLSIHTSFILTIQPPLPYQTNGSEFSL